MAVVCLEVFEGALELLLVHRPQLAFVVGVVEVGAFFLELVIYDGHEVGECALALRVGDSVLKFGGQVASELEGLADSFDGALLFADFNVFSLLRELRHLGVWKVHLA